MHLKKVSLFPEKFPVTDRYPFNLTIFQKTPFLEFSSPVTFFAGENATGKSTLMQAMARRCGIYIWCEDSGRDRYDNNPYEKQLVQAIDVEWANGVIPGSFFGSDMFRNYAQIIDEWAKSDPGLLEYYGGKSLVTQSHGQSIMSFFRACFKVKGLYFLDEPETGLSPLSQLLLLDLLIKTGRQGHAQFIIATHSPILLSCPDAVLYNFDAIPINRMNYKDSQHFIVYRDLFRNK